MLYIFRFFSSEGDDDDDDDDGEQVSSQRDRHRGTRELKTVNGKIKIDMTPPDIKLQDKEKRARKLAANGKVR